MRVAVVGVRPVRMGVAQLGVTVFVRVSPLDGCVARGLVIVVSVVSVAVRVDGVLVSVRVLMALASEEPGSAEDEGHSSIGRHGRRLAEDRER
jgi:hypothetical protein